MINESYNNRETLLLKIQDEVITGGICFDEFTSFQLENAYIAFCAGADLACIMMCQTAIESYINDDEQIESNSFYDLIEKSSYSLDFKQKLHHLRKYRNKWVHIRNRNKGMKIDHIELKNEAIYAYRLTLEVFHYYLFV